MAQDLALPAGFAAPSTIFAGVKDDAMSAGITGGFAVISYKGKVWSIRQGGNDTPLMRADGDGPRASLDLTILKASPHISKVFYEKGYTPGDDAAPDCFSNNGATPDPTALKKQNPVCATCPQNVFGSRINQATGAKGKACSDSKRLAVMPTDDLKNNSGMGPMLLRIPAASLLDMKRYADGMHGLGYEYFTVSTRVSFDVNEAFPKIIFNAVKPLGDEDAKLVLNWRTSPDVENVLSTQEGVVPATEAAQAGSKPGFLEPDLVEKTVAPAVAKGPADRAAVPDGEIAALKAQLAAAEAKAKAPEPAPKTLKELLLERLAALEAGGNSPAAAAQKALEDAAAKKAADDAAAAVAAKAAKAEEKRKAAAAKALADEVARKVAAEAAAKAPAEPQDELAALRAKLAALEGTPAAMVAAEPTQQNLPLEGEVLPPAAQGLTPSSIEDRLNALMGKTA